jgi:hypothetical protein
LTTFKNLYEERIKKVSNLNDPLHKVIWKQ